MADSGQVMFVTFALLGMGSPTVVTIVLNRNSLPTMVTQLKRAIVLDQKWDTRIVFDLYEANIMEELRSFSSGGVAPSVPQSSKLDDLAIIDDIWPEGIPIKGVPFVVKVESVPTTTGSAPEDSVPDLINAFETLNTRRRNAVSAFRDGSSASAAAGVSDFIKQQTNDTKPIYNGRPYSRTALPVHLYHHAFEQFATKLKATENLSAARYAAVEKLLYNSQRLYPTEAERWDAIQPFLAAAIGHVITHKPIPKCQADGVVTFDHLASGQCVFPVIIEIKNEIGTGGSDPWIQAAESYAIYWSQEKLSELRGASCCPSLVIAIAGPWMCVSGAVFLDRVVVQPLTDYLWLGHHPQQENRLVHLAQVFEAISVSTTSLINYYSSLLSQAYSVDTQLYYPYIRCYSGPAGDIPFTYKKQLGNPNVVRPVFEATLDNGNSVVVKFAEFYNFQAHKLLADKSLAPALLFHSPTPSYGGLWMIVMEFCGEGFDAYFNAHPKLELSAREHVRSQVREALDILHGANLVFGDLRRPNVLVVPGADGKLGVRLVDFDWCGKEGQALYPAALNQGEGMRWAGGAEKRSVIEKEHDNEMLELLFKK
ncbi:hypothetical protein BDV93DRAFT_479692 [Ceratobasidium sp. AG-I]|nr:hypothetical protein BDV93DRAFT_479692 [Ceratobasidium sp. AG-I]